MSMIDYDMLPFLKMRQEWNSFWDLSTFTEKSLLVCIFLQHITINLENEMATTKTHSNFAWQEKKIQIANRELGVDIGFFLTPTPLTSTHIGNS